MRTWLRALPWAIRPARWLRAIQQHPRALGVGITVLAVLVVSVGVGLVLLTVLSRSDPDRLSAWATFGLMIATLFLVVGSAVAAWYFHQQTVEAKRMREATLRPVIIITEAKRPDSTSPFVEALLAPGTREKLLVEVSLKNIGPGPALDIELTGDACYRHLFLDDHRECGFSSSGSAPRNTGHSCQRVNRGQHRSP